MEARRRSGVRRWWLDTETEGGTIDGSTRLRAAVVLLHAGPQTLRERVVGRAKEHTVLTLDEPGSAEYLADAAHGSRVVAAWLEPAGVRVVRLDMARISPDDGCRALEDALLGRATGQ